MPFTSQEAAGRGAFRSPASPAFSGIRPRLPRARLEALLGNLRATVAGLEWQAVGTEWADYTITTSYSDRGAASKQAVVERFLRLTDGQWVWDLGANTGVFSQIATDLGRNVLSLDVDPAAAERHYRALRARDANGPLPLVMDLSNPSPALGWANSERLSLVERANADVLIALALVHHISIGNNVPLPHLSAFMSRLGRHLIIEFVPKEDARVAAMLAGRRDVFADYSLDAFQSAFGTDWQLIEEQPVEDSTRVLFLFRRR